MRAMFSLSYLCCILVVRLSLWQSCLLEMEHACPLDLWAPVSVRWRKQGQILKKWEDRVIDTIRKQKKMRLLVVSSVFLVAAIGAVWILPAALIWGLTRCLSEPRDTVTLLQLETWILSFVTTMALPCWNIHCPRWRYSWGLWELAWRQHSSFVWILKPATATILASSFQAARDKYWQHWQGGEIPFYQDLPWNLGTGLQGCLMRFAWCSSASDSMVPKVPEGKGLLQAFPSTLFDFDSPRVQVWVLHPMHFHTRRYKKAVCILLESTSWGEGYCQTQQHHIGRQMLSFEALLMHEAITDMQTSYMSMYLWYLMIWTSTRGFWKLLHCASVRVPDSTSAAFAQRSALNS